jgi:hypothetical protein
MKRFCTFGVSMLGVLAAIFMAATSASAASNLVLTAEGNPIPTGATLESRIFVKECLQATTGKLTVNSKPTDKAKFTTSVEAECPEGESISGHATEVDLTSAGVMTVKAKLTLTVAGPCKYSITTGKGKFPVPGFVFGKGETTAKLVKAGSAKTCAKTLVTSYEAAVSNGEGIISDEL